jgi:co-chaperonin GroES (HSP10)
MKAEKNLIIVGDRVLIEPDEGADKTTSGLYLPDTVKEKQKVVGGYVVKAGPGYPVHDPNISQEPWVVPGKKDIKYIPLQANEGDYAIFLKESAIEIEFEGKKYLIVPHSTILALVRIEITEGTSET